MIILFSYLACISQTHSHDPIHRGVPTTMALFTQASSTTYKEQWEAPEDQDLPLTQSSPLVSLMATPVASSTE